MMSPYASSTFAYAPPLQTSPEARPPEDVLIQWKKGHLLGRGAFGEVYLGMTNAGEFIAVKQVRLPDNENQDETSSQSKTVRALRHEIQLMRGLHHENIVRYLGTQHVDHTLNIFLEYVPGGSIASILHKFSRFPEDVIRSFTKQILSGLAYLHAHHIIHRDIKGANILVGTSGIIKVADFGASKKLVSLTGSLRSSTSGPGEQSQYSVVGSPYWMAPEVIQGIPYDHRADTWSVGALVIEMFTGKPPFAHLDAVPAMFQTATGATPEIPADASLLARDFLLKCFTRDPALRPSATDLLNTHPFVCEVSIFQPISNVASSHQPNAHPSSRLVFQKDPPIAELPLPTSVPQESISMMPLSSASFHSELISYLKEHGSLTDSSF